MVIKPRLLLLFLGVWFQPHRGGDEPHWKPEQKLALHCANDYGKFLIFLIVLIVWMWPHLGVSVVFIFSCCPCQNYLWVRALQLFRVSKLKESFKNWIQVAFWNLFSSVDSHGSSLWICPWAFNQSPTCIQPHQTPADLFLLSTSRLRSVLFLSRSSPCSTCSLLLFYHKPLGSQKTQGAISSLLLSEAMWGNLPTSFHQTSPFSICCNSFPPL